MTSRDAVRQLIIAIHERHADAILNGKKTHELRRRLRSVSEGDRVYLYATAPVSAVVGWFVVRSVSRNAPDSMWAEVGAGFAISETEFDAYTSGAAEVTALEVAEPSRLRRPAAVPELIEIAPDFTPPQSVTMLRNPGLREHLEQLAV